MSGAFSGRGIKGLRDHQLVLLFDLAAEEKIWQPLACHVNDRSCAALSLLLALALHAGALRLGLPVSQVLSGQDPHLLNRLTLELR